ncbi:MAG: hypothetical protein AAB895_03695, partial [Patescibacteria group bacterium]
VNAITLDKTVYTEGDEILIQEAGGATIYWNTNSDTPTFLSSEHEALVNINIGGILNNGNYVIMEHQNGDNDCYWLLQTAEECRNSPEFINEFFFTVNPPPSGGGGGEEENPEPTSAGGRIATNAYPPEISILSSIKGLVFSKDFLINYKARLQNEKGINYEDDPLSAVNLTPVSLFYSDKPDPASWYTGLTGDMLDKILIAKDLPAVGQYKLSIKDLVPGTLYRIIVNALDASGRLGEKISEFFSVDFTAPTFVVTVDPPVAKHERVAIIISSSEELSVAPKVFVRQRGAEAVIVEVSKKDDTYIGEYSVTEGFDGTAQVEISGDDIAGNTGTLIVGGGTFTVGVNPPIKPTIISPSQNEAALTEKIDIQGTTREDTTITATVNGVDKYTAKPTAKGEFSIKDVILKKNAVNGKNIINITATDTLGVVSDGTVLIVLFNTPPT